MAPLLCLFALAVILAIQLALKFFLFSFFAIEPRIHALPWFGAVAGKLDDLEAVRKGSCHGRLRSSSILPSARFPMGKAVQGLALLQKFGGGL